MHSISQFRIYLFISVYDIVVVVVFTVSQPHTQTTHTLYTLTHFTHSHTLNLQHCKAHATTNEHASAIIIINAIIP